MYPYPSSLPVSELSYLLGFVTTHSGDLPDAIHAAWSVVGYGLSLIPVPPPTPTPAPPAPPMPHAEAIAHLRTLLDAHRRSVTLPVIPWAVIIPIILDWLKQWLSGG